MEKDDKGSTMIRMGVSGWMFLLVQAYPGCPGSKAVKQSLLLLLSTRYKWQRLFHCPVLVVCLLDYCHKLFHPLCWLSDSSTKGQWISHNIGTCIVVPAVVCRWSLLCPVFRGRQSCTTSSASWRSGSRFSRLASDCCRSRFSSRRNVDFSAISHRTRLRWRFRESFCCRRLACCMCLFNTIVLLLHAASPL